MPYIAADEENINFVFSLLKPKRSKFLVATTLLLKATIQSLDELERSIKTRNIKIAIIATPSNQSQNVVNKLVASNIKCILNYSQSSPKVPEGIILKPVDPISTLQSMAFHLKNEHLTNNHK